MTPGADHNTSPNRASRTSQTPMHFCLLYEGQDPEVTWKLLSLARGEVMNGGFGLVLDGTQEAEQRAKMMLGWDVSNGVSHPYSLPCLLSPSVLLPLPTADLRLSSVPFIPEMAIAGPSCLSSSATASLLGCFQRLLCISRPQAIPSSLASVHTGGPWHLTLPAQ